MTDLRENSLEEEIKFLEAIYINELEVDRDEHGGVERIRLVLHPSTGDDDDQKFVCMTLILDISSQYPHMAPDISIRNPRGIGEEEIQSLIEDMMQLGQNSRGDSMLFQLIELAKDSLTEGNIPHCPCMICLEHFQESDIFSKTPCYHYFHSVCLARYVKHCLGQHEETVSASTPHIKQEEQVKLICPVCREPISYQLEDLPATPVEENVPFQPTPQLRAMQQKMASILEHQRAIGGLIDLEVERNKFLLKDNEVVHLSLPGMTEADEKRSSSASGHDRQKNSRKNENDRGACGRVDNCATINENGSKLSGSRSSTVRHAGGRGSNRVEGVRSPRGSRGNNHNESRTKGLRDYGSRDNYDSTRSYGRRDGGRNEKRHIHFDRPQSGKRDDGFLKKGFDENNRCRTERNDSNMNIDTQGALDLEKCYTKNETELHKMTSTESHTMEFKTSAEAVTDDLSKLDSLVACSSEENTNSNLSKQQVEDKTGNMGETDNDGNSKENSSYGRHSSRQSPRDGNNHESYRNKRNRGGHTGWRNKNDRGSGRDGFSCRGGRPKGSGRPSQESDVKVEKYDACGKRSDISEVSVCITDGKQDRHQTDCGQSQGRHGQRQVMSQQNVHSVKNDEVNAKGNLQVHCGFVRPPMQDGSVFKVINEADNVNEESLSTNKYHVSNHQGSSRNAGRFIGRRHDEKWECQKGKKHQEYKDTETNEKSEKVVYQSDRDWRGHRSNPVAYRGRGRGRGRKHHKDDDIDLSSNDGGQRIVFGPENHSNDVDCVSDRVATVTISDQGKTGGGTTRGDGKDTASPRPPPGFHAHMRERVNPPPGI